MSPFWHWLKEDHALLKELYPSAPKEFILSKIKNHSWTAIQKEASRLRIKRSTKSSEYKKNKINIIKMEHKNPIELKKMKADFHIKPWTDVEHEILEIFYPRSSKTVILDTLRKRSWFEITIEAELLGIKRHVKDDEGKKKKIAYTLSKKKLEKLLYGMEYTIEEIAMKLNTTPAIVRRNISRYGL
jgi:hypothetical protein